MSEEKTLSLELPYDVALVLYEWLAAKRQRETAADPDGEMTDPEQLAASCLEAAFEPLLAEIFSSDYDALVRTARERVVKTHSAG